MARAIQPPVDLSSLLLDLRLKSGLTQEALAERAGITYKYYQAVEAGRKKDLRLSTLTKLARAHGLRLSEFFFQSERLRPALVAEKAAVYRAGKKTRKK